MPLPDHLPSDAGPSAKPRGEIVDRPQPPASPVPSDSPHVTYTRLLEERRRQAEAIAVRERLLGSTRLAVFALGAGQAWLTFGLGWLSAWWLVVPAAAFAVAFVGRERVAAAWRRALRAAGVYERALARLENRWRGTGQPGDRFVDEHHPNSTDLDLFGTGSLFELLCTARTRKGEDTLAAWLKAPATPEEIRARQAAVDDLRGRLGLREDLALLGADVPAGVDLDRLAAWGAAPPVLTSRPARVAAFVLGALGGLSLIGWLFFETTSLPFAVMLLVEGAFFLWLRRPVIRVIAPIDRKAHDLAVFAGLLARLEREPFQAPRLRELQAALDTGGAPPSRRIAQLGRLVEMLDSRRNPLFAPIAPVLLWGTQLAFAVEAWRATSGPAVPRWLAALGEIEALCALATYAYENPTDPFPEIAADGPCFDGRALGHPLIPRERCVRNDLCLGGERRVLIVSGSNMSGKSTLLRTAGVNAVLALAGAPVRAERLRLSPLVVGATLRIQDSLQEGKSRFFAEITRVRQLVDLAPGHPPLFFLLDEIFHGTNSHDRRQGAEAIVRGLIDRGAIGLVTTHDLALAAIADRLAPRAANVHFEDQLVDGTMTFDYRMRPGVVQHSNALALMRAVGLEV
jgi:MutS domain V